MAEAVVHSIIGFDQEDLETWLGVLSNMSESWKHGSIIQDTIDTGMERQVAPVKLKATDHFGSAVSRARCRHGSSTKFNAGPTSNICCFRSTFIRPVERTRA